MDWTAITVEATFRSRPTAKRATHKRAAAATWHWAELGPPHAKRHRLSSAEASKAKVCKGSGAAAAAVDVQSMQQGMGTAGTAMLPDNVCHSPQHGKVPQASCSLQPPSMPKKLPPQPYCRSRHMAQPSVCEAATATVQPPCCKGCCEPCSQQDCPAKPPPLLPVQTSPLPPPPPPELQQQQQQHLPACSQSESVRSSMGGSSLASKVWSSMQATAKLLLSVPQRGLHTPMQSQQQPPPQQQQQACKQQQSQQAQHCPAETVAEEQPALQQSPVQQAQQQLQRGQQQLPKLRRPRSPARVQPSASLSALSSTAAATLEAAEVSDARGPSRPRCCSAPPALTPEQSSCGRPKKVVLLMSCATHVHQQWSRSSRYACGRWHKPRVRRCTLDTTALLHLKPCSCPQGRLSLEWLRAVSADEARAYLMAIDGLGRKSAACILLLALRLRDFPVDTNVGRICARLG